MHIIQPHLKENSSGVNQSITMLFEVTKCCLEEKPVNRQRTLAEWGRKKMKLDMSFFSPFGQC